MQSKLTAVAGVLAAIALAPAWHGQSVEATEVNLTWYPCPFETAEDQAHDDPNATPAECADVALPLCYPGVCDSTKTISVFVKRLLAAKPPADKQARALWMVQGGPGFGSPSLEPGLLDAYKAFNGTLSVYTIDHRGTGRSTILDCTTNSNKLTRWHALAKCHHELKTLYGGNGAAGFSVTSAASDLAAVMQAPSLFDSTDIFVYGVSYGTYTVTRLMHMQPPNVKGYVLDSIQSEEFGSTKDAPYYSNWDRDVGDAVDQYFAHCDNDSFCSSKLGKPSSKQALVDVYNALESRTSPCYDVLLSKANMSNMASPAEYVGSTLYSMLGDKSTWSLLAPFIFRLRRCSQDDRDMFGRMTTLDDSDARMNLFLPPRRGGSAYLKAEGFSSVLYNTIVFSELWQRPSPTMDAMANDTKNALFGSKNANGLHDTFQEYCVYVQNSDAVCQGYPVYSGGGFVYPRDAYWNKTASIPPGASAMLLSGLMDPATPPKYAQDQFTNMKGTDKVLLQFPFGGHGTLSTTPLVDQPNVDCANAIFYQYMRNRGKLHGLDTTCVDKVQTLDFKKVLNADRANAIFGSDVDVWGPDSPPLPPVQQMTQPPLTRTPTSTNSVLAHAFVSAVVVLLLLLTL
ncbi:hypothetical protein H310_03512 [Aphanomyces invadans]|uniref:AB hydrolase-1 domain-containing protein n=1 Tax=Aphanomyces invadans TaxID=157072 RepID=A0A024UHG4_9STRA|nr:hypothetical protein H310_03512 [Aphanomyces invadans]ETW05851.1 hypothetical protein H310_03512 [Aphanomyces invadans]|eukprot:XP_008865628.1 hypothetical protein H310_03512 [Aphanomyces invadans]